MLTSADCPLCDLSSWRLVWRDERLSVILADEPAYAGFTRVVWGRHVAEMTELDDGDRRYLMTAVFEVELAMRTVLQPDKINLASLGNLVPHIHWHVIPRYVDDAAWPEPVWARNSGVPTDRTHPIEGYVEHAAERLARMAKP